VLKKKKGDLKGAQPLGGEKIGQPECADKRQLFCSYKKKGGHKELGMLKLWLVSPSSKGGGHETTVISEGRELF